MDTHDLRQASAFPISFRSFDGPCVADRPGSILRLYDAKPDPAWITMAQYNEKTLELLASKARFRSIEIIIKADLIIHDAEMAFRRALSKTNKISTGRSESKLSHSRIRYGRVWTQSIHPLPIVWLHRPRPCSCDRCYPWTCGQRPATLV